jgi:DNA-binding transcriptional ArsR family regulator
MQPRHGGRRRGGGAVSSQGTVRDGEAAALFGALADPTRLQVVQLLGQHPRRAGELAAAAGMSAPAMSRHLRVLLRAGLIADERLAEDARARVFRLRPQSLAALQAWLDQLQAHWDEQLASFKRHVEKGSLT